MAVEGKLGNERGEILAPDINLTDRVLHGYHRKVATMTDRVSTRLRESPLMLTMAGVMVMVSGCGLISVTESTTPAPTTTVSAPRMAPGDDYVTVTGPARHDYQITTPGSIHYCPVDALGRATCAYGLLTHAVKPNSTGELPDPAGWPKRNQEVTIPAMPGVSGSKTYRGWMMNRSHLIADSLGGQEITANLVTGTRTQNVGSHQEKGQYAGGMAHTEVMARNYLADGRGESCPLYYAVTPQYEGNELLPRTVTVDIDSCDHQINQHVVVTNTAYGWTINYTDGSFTRVQ